MLVALLGQLIWFWLMSIPRANMICLTLITWAWWFQAQVIEIKLNSLILWVNPSCFHHYPRCIYILKKTSTLTWIEAKPRSLDPFCIISRIFHWCQSHELETLKHRSLCQTNLPGAKVLTLSKTRWADLLCITSMAAI